MLISYWTEQGYRVNLYTHRPEMAHCKRKADGERSWAAEPSSERVTRGEDRKHQHKRDDELDAEDLSNWHSFTRSRSTQGAFVCAVRRRRQTFEHSGADDCTDRLYDDVQQCPACVHTSMHHHHHHHHHHVRLFVTWQNAWHSKHKTYTKM